MLIELQRWASTCCFRSLTCYLFASFTGDEAEWHEWSKVGDPVMHIELRRWADLFVIAPLSANSLAKMANGMCDNLVTCIARAWDFKRPLLVSVCMYRTYQSGTCCVYQVVLHSSITHSSSSNRAR
jgi:flavoprotein